jgi:hypothetical protein
MRHNFIVDSLRHLIVPVEGLIPDPLNARLHPERNLEAIKDSLCAFGQQKPIVVRKENNTIAAGNGTYKAACELGWTKIAAAVNSMTDAEFAGYGLADNRTAELARWNLDVLSKIEELLEDTGNPMAGWSDEEVAAIRWKREGDDGLGSYGHQEAELIFDNPAVIEAAFSYFRERGFPYVNLPIHACMEQINGLANTDSGTLISTNSGCGVADTYCYHRWNAADPEWKAPFDVFMDDYMMRFALRKTLELGANIGTGVFSGLRFCQGSKMLANFRPGFALFIYRKYLKTPGVILDTSHGYGGRLVGFMASRHLRYVGIDPNQQTSEACQKMVDDLGFGSRVNLIRKPAEDVKAKEVGKVDLCFTSPPYWCKEHYCNDPTQSWVRYPGEDDWVRGFLIPTLRLQFACLRPGGYAIMNIADVKVKDYLAPLVKRAVESALSVGFLERQREAYPIPRVPGLPDPTAPKKGLEPVLIFQKPE